MAGVTGMMHLPHDKYHFGTRYAVPNEVRPIWWWCLPPQSAISIPRMSLEYWSVGTGDQDLLASIRDVLSTLASQVGISYASGELGFEYRGYFDLQGWIISGDYPLGEDNQLFTATPQQLVDDYIRKIKVPYVNPGSVLTADQQLQTVRESIGDDRNTDEVGLENVNETSDPASGEATRHQAVIDQAAWYDLGPHMFFEHREWMGMRRGNGMPVGERKQRYAGNLETSIKAIRSKGKYAIVLFTVSMPHIYAMGNDWDEQDEPVSIYDNWMELIFTNQYAPLDHMSLQDEISIQQARDRYQDYVTGTTNAENNRVPVGHFQPTANYDKYITMKRNYSVKPGSFQQKPLQIDIDIDFTEHAPFILVPSRM